MKMSSYVENRLCKTGFYPYEWVDAMTNDVGLPPDR